MNQHSYPHRLWKAFSRIFIWGWKATEMTAFIAGAILLINGLLYAFQAGGFEPKRVVSIMSCFLTPFLEVLDIIAPPISWLIRFSSSIWDVSSLIEVIAMLAGLIGVISGIISFIRELFRFHIHE